MHWQMNKSSLDYRMRQPEIYMFGHISDAPNNPDLPVLIYRAVMPREWPDKANVFEAHFVKNNWFGTWRDTIFTYRHFHSNAHEVLGIAEGNVVVEIGGEQLFDLEEGDIIILPAGTSHRRISCEEVLVVGAYPKGQEKYDICHTVDDCEPYILPQFFVL